MTELYYDPIIIETDEWKNYWKFSGSSYANNARIAFEELIMTFTINETLSNKRRELEKKYNLPYDKMLWFNTQLCRKQILPRFVQIVHRPNYIKYAQSKEKTLQKMRGKIRRSLKILSKEQLSEIMLIILKDGGSKVE